MSWLWFKVNESFKVASASIFSIEFYNTWWSSITAAPKMSSRLRPLFPRASVSPTIPSHSFCFSVCFSRRLCSGSTRFIPHHLAYTPDFCIVLTPLPVWSSKQSVMNLWWGFLPERPEGRNRWITYLSFSEYELGLEEFQAWEIDNEVCKTAFWGLL